MADKELIHIIDDEPIIHEVLGELLSSEGYTVESSTRGEEALAKYPDYEFDLILLDLLMPGMDGIEVLHRIKKIDPQAVVIIITAYASVESAIEAMKSGAFDYIQKPFKHEELILTIERALEHKRLQQENVRLKAELKQKFSFENIIGKSRVMQNVFDLIRAAAPTKSTILIQGESGTGKELVARAIHQNSDRIDFPFITVNSGSLPPDLLESHLFGHVKGAFTGATAQKEGLFEAADRGTIFFDEISTLNIETQAKLLRVMQEREFMHLGGTKTVKVDVRVIAATNRNLRALVSEDRFQEDLYYRLSVIPIELPPLRERREDVPPLVDHFLRKHAHRVGREIERIGDAALDRLRAYDWPGNVRELENTIERAVVLAVGPVIDEASISIVEPPTGRERGGLPSARLHENVEWAERESIRRALQQAGGVKKDAAALLGISQRALSHYLGKHRIG